MEDKLIVKLDKKDVISMLRGTYPNIMKLDGSELIQVYGGMCDTVKWKSESSKVWKKYSIQELYELYQELKAEEERINKKFGLE